MSKLDDFIDRAGAGAVLMVSPAAHTDIRHNTEPMHWHLESRRETYRGAVVELHDEWSWGWMVRKADGSYVEDASAIEARQGGNGEAGAVADESAAREAGMPEGSGA